MLFKGLLKKLIHKVLLPLIDFAANCKLFIKIYIFMEDKNMKQKIITVSVLTCIIVVFGILYFNYNCDVYVNNTSFFDIIVAFTAFFGVFGIIFQSQRSKNIEEAQFIFELNQEFINNEKYQKVLDILSRSDNVSLTEDEIKLITHYCGYFEPLYILLKKEIVKIEMVDSLFCYRFFSVINNKYVQDFVLTPDKEYFINIVKLHYLWKKYKLNKRYDNHIPMSDTDLSLLPWYNNIRMGRR